MNNYEQRTEQKEQKEQNIILNIKQHHLHQIIEQSPKKQEQVLHDLIIILSIILLTKMSKHQIIEQRLKQKQDLHLKSLIKAYHHSLQVKKQVVAKITQNLHTNRKGKQEDHQIHNQRQKFKKIYSKKNQNHKQKQKQKQTPNTTLK